MSIFGGKTEKKNFSELEADGFGLVMEILQLARNGQPYRQLLPVLKDRAEHFPRVAKLVQTLADNLSEH